MKRRKYRRWYESSGNDMVDLAMGIGACSLVGLIALIISYFIKP
jgi:hypothetical protein